ncbi:MAG: Spy/CpxP family protein refolding chaperone [Polyangiaceae bacterium]|nr:Spy/CpxP family protein refolding chaperone [Polyangiaceae bacterium]
MYPGFFGWWKRGGCGPSAGCGPHDGAHMHGHGHGCGPRGFGRHGGGPFGPGGGGPFAHGGPDWDAEGGGFGVRRPLRFLAWKLELEEEQVAKLATILDDLKTERAQASVDNRRSVASFADAVAGDTFDAAKAKEAGDARVKSAEQLREAVVKALGEIHAILDGEQRKKLSYLLRTGTLSI